MASSMNFCLALSESGIIRFDYMRLSGVFLKIAPAHWSALGQQREQVREPSSRSMFRIKKFFRSAFMSLVLLASSPLIAHQITAPVADPTFYRDVLPILQEHCQICHRSGGIAPMAFENYEGTRPYSAAIRAAVQNRSMPPWFAEKGIGKISNDLSLTEEQIALFAAWAEANSPAGTPPNPPPKTKSSNRQTIPAPDLAIKRPN